MWKLSPSSGFRYRRPAPSPNSNPRDAETCPNRRPGVAPNSRLPSGALNVVRSPPSAIRMLNPMPDPSVRPPAFAARELDETPVSSATASSTTATNCRLFRTFPPWVPVEPAVCPSGAPGATTHERIAERCTATSTRACTWLYPVAHAPTDRAPDSRVAGGARACVGGCRLRVADPLSLQPRPHRQRGVSGPHRPGDRQCRDADAGRWLGADGSRRRLRPVDGRPEPDELSGCAPAPHRNRRSAALTTRGAGRCAVPLPPHR